MGSNGAYVLHLERVCREIERENTFMVEIRPLIKSEHEGEILEGMYIVIKDDGVVVLCRDNQTVSEKHLTLANYKNTWRCWRGRPDERARREMKWL